MRTIFALFLLIFAIHTQAGAQSIQEHKTYTGQELLDQFKKIEADIAEESKAYREELLKTKDEFISEEDFKNFLDYKVETMIIDSILNRKLNIIYISSDFTPVIAEAIDKYDVLINKYYKLLLESLPNDISPLFKAHQEAWILYKDTYMKFHNPIYFEYRYYGREGQTITFPLKELDLYKDRLNEIFIFFETYSSL